MNKDQLVEGPFGSNACYEQTFNHEDKEITTWLCFGSGFTSSTLMTKGSNTVNGTSKDKWKWAGVKAIPIGEDDKKANLEQTHKMDMKNLRHFSQNDFMDAAEYIGMFKVQ